MLDCLVCGAIGMTVGALLGLLVAVFCFDMAGRR